MHPSPLQPPALQPGSLIGVTCPAGHTAAELVEGAAVVFRDWGYRVKLGKTVGAGAHYFAGTDAERLADLQAMLDDESVEAVFMGRGGYGLSRIIDRLDFTAFVRKPKWICGFSDITVLHSHILANYGIATLHGPMCRAYSCATAAAPHVLSMKAALEGGLADYRFPAAQHNRPGTAQGVLTGGNLAILAHLSGSVSQIETRGRILFLEDIGEHLYQIDRLLLNLKRAGLFDGLEGLLLGDFTDIEDTARPFGQTLEEIVTDKVAEYDFPVGFNFPAGHEEVNFTLKMGAPHRLSVGKESLGLAELRVA